MKYRTDLAVECQEMLDAARSSAGRDGERAAGKPPEAGRLTAAGYEVRKRAAGDDIEITEIVIDSPQGAELLGKGEGTYVTIEARGIIEQRDGVKERTARVLAEELQKMIPFRYDLKTLVVGLGNEKVTPDSLGPHTVDKVKITAHLFEIFGADGDWETSNVSGFNPSVTGVTGMETADLIAKVVSLVKPDAVLIVDSLAARNVERLSTTIQLCDSGIEPGAGMGNRRKAISQATLGCKVVAIGVPTVIDSRTLIAEASEIIASWDAEATEKYLQSRSFDMIVTSTDIDQIIKDFSDVIANAINITLHPGIYS